eukprot:9122217-Prorocentrum_lima.AAC.1
MAEIAPASARLKNYCAAMLHMHSALARKGRSRISQEQSSLARAGQRPDALDSPRRRWQTL